MAKKKPAKNKKALTNDYEYQKKIWYKKLEKSGFKDIEQSDGRIKTNSSIFFRYYTTETSWKSKEEYYRMATLLLQDLKFDRELEKVVWEYHSNGIGVKDIVKTINSLKLFKTNREYVQQIILKVRQQMYKLYGVTRD